MPQDKGTASTRLLSMKFMQRAAAAEEKSSPASTPDGRPAKRMRMSNGTSTPKTPAQSDAERLKAAQAEEQLQRSAVMARIAAEAGETHWVLNVKEPAKSATPLRIVQTSFADLDSRDDNEEDDEEEEEGEVTTKMVAGRMMFGQMKKAPEAPKEESDSSSGSGSEDSDDSDEEENAYNDIRAARAEQKAKKVEEQIRLMALRRKKQINLNKNGNGPSTPLGAQKEPDLSRLGSISGGASSRKDSFRPGHSRRGKR